MPNTFPSNSVGGGGATTLQTSHLPRLAPELTYPTEKTSSTQTFKTIIGINAQGALTTALSASGRFIFSLAEFSGMTIEAVTIKLTVDDVVIWYNTFNVGNSTVSLISNINDSSEYGFLVARNLLIEIETQTDTSISFSYRLRPIL